eukprot:6192698-Pleurochrysis_carterae.AAC.1
MAFRAAIWQQPIQAAFSAVLARIASACCGQAIVLVITEHENGVRVYAYGGWVYLSASLRARICAYGACMPASVRAGVYACRRACA